MQQFFSLRYVLSRNEKDIFEKLIRINSKIEKIKIELPYRPKKGWGFDFLSFNDRLNLTPEEIQFLNNEHNNVGGYNISGISINSSHVVLAIQGRYY